MSADMPKRLPPFCVEDVDRHGNIRVYFRRKGSPKIRLTGTPWTPDFMAAYEAALAGAAPATRADGTTPYQTAKPQTLRWLCEQYFKSADFRLLDTSTRTVRRRILEIILHEPIKPGAKETFADFPLARLTARAIKVLRDRKLDMPEAANSRVKALRQVFLYAMGENHIQMASNPARDVAYLKNGSDGHHTWTIDEVRAFEAAHPIDSQARLAMALLLYSGCRRSDVISFGRQHVRDGWLKYTQHKNRIRAPITIELPVLPALQAVIDAAPAGHLTFITTAFGKPFTANGFGNRFRKWCIEAGLPHCSAHGLRKAGATIAAENGATENQLMAIFGWRNPKMAADYTRKARRKKMAGDAMHLVDLGAETGTEVSHFSQETSPGGTISAKK